MNNVRLSRPEDLTGILNLYRELRPHDPELDSEKASSLFANILSNPSTHIIVAETDGEIASTCMLAVVPNLANGGQPFGIIEHVVTAQRYRRRGLSRAVLTHALQLAWQLKCCKVVLLSGAQRNEAHRLYESVGFRGDVERGFVAKLMGTGNSN